MSDATPVPIRTAALGSIPHGFLGRQGGVSQGITAGLDMGARGQAPTPALVENRRRAVASVLPGSSLVTAYQVHSAEVAVVTAPIAEQARPRVDGLVTDRPGLLLGILTADCAPVLFADADAGVVGAAHAGWKGALGGIAEATVAAMVAIGADRMRTVAAIGPCIARASYEVDAAFARRFEEADPANERFFTPGRPAHLQFDLEGYVAARLAAAGVRRVEALGRDTYGDAQCFFSYRRATHRGEPDYGRQIALIGLSG